MAADPPSALSPYRILDLSGEIGQYAGRAFAEMGADVIKVEPPGGDRVRRIGPFAGDQPDPERSLLWSTLNMSKRGITLDIERPEGRALLAQLVDRCDAVIESYQPGYLASLGLDYETLSRDRPRLVWLSITGFGQEGPYRGYAWSDLIGLALGGLLYLWGEPGKPPTRARSAQAYYHASMGGAIGGMAALYHARRTGQGQFVDVSMQEVETFLVAGPGGISNYWPMMGMNITRSGTAMNYGNLVSKIYFRCKDGHMALGTILGPGFPQLVALMKKDGAAGVLEDPSWENTTRYAPLAGQRQITPAEEALAADTIEAWLMLRTRRELMEIAIANELLMFPLLTPAENIGSEQLTSRGYFQEVDQEDGLGPITYPGPPIVLSGTPWRLRSRAPRIGEHNDAVFGEAGVSPERLAGLKEAGVV